MYQTGMCIKDVLEEFTNGGWEADLRYDCSEDHYTARLQSFDIGSQARYEEMATFTIKCDREPDRSLRTALQLWLVLSELEREILTEHTEELIREGIEKTHAEELNQKIQAAVQKIEAGEVSTL